MSARNWTMMTLTCAPRKPPQPEILSYGNANQVTAFAARPHKAAPLMRLVRTKPLKSMIVTLIVPALDLLRAPLCSAPPCE
jgi:hypothetical protein